MLKKVSQPGSSVITDLRTVIAWFACEPMPKTSTYYIFRTTRFDDDINKTIKVTVVVVVDLHKMCISKKQVGI